MRVEFPSGSRFLGFYLTVVWPKLLKVNSNSNSFYQSCKVVIFSDLSLLYMISLKVTYSFLVATLAAFFQ